MDFFKKITIYSILLVLALTFQYFVFAEGRGLNMQDVLTQEGLSFTQPLPEGLSVQTSTIEFHTYKTISFQKNIVKDKPTPTLEPTKKISETPTPTTKPKLEPTLTPIPSPTQNPLSGKTESGSARQLSNGGLNADTLFNMSNNYRQSKGLASFQKDDRICQLALSRAPEISAEIAENRMHSGKNSHNFPYWFTENIITMRSEQEAFNWWVNDEIHRIQIEADNKYSCVACSGFACAQEFTNFQPK